MSDYFVDHFPAKYRDRVPRVIHRDERDRRLVDRGERGLEFRPQCRGRTGAEEWGNDPGIRGSPQGNVGCPRAHPRHECQRRTRLHVLLIVARFGGQYFLQSGDRELAGCMIRAYNDWQMEEWCRVYPGSFIPLSLSGFILGPDWMAEEIHRMAAKGCHAVSFHSDTHRFGLARPPWRRVGSGLAGLPGHRHRHGVPFREFA